MRLDAAVLTAYGFSAKKALLAQLLDPNQQVATKMKKVNLSRLRGNASHTIERQAEARTPTPTPGWRTARHRAKPRHDEPGKTLRIHRLVRQAHHR